jgi:hypothetical protein
MSNACFIFNNKFAQEFIKNFSKIETTSDLFIHLKLVKMSNTKDYILYPSLAMQLSFSDNLNFKSQIRPRKLNSSEDERRKVLFRTNFDDFIRDKIDNSVIKTAKIFGKEFRFIKDRKLDNNFDEFFFKMNENYFYSNLSKIISQIDDYDVFIDVGSHMGRFALVVKTLFPKKEYIAFEPDYFSFNVLKRNLEINDFTDYILCNISVGLNEENDQDILLHKNNRNSFLASSYDIFVKKHKLKVYDI